MISSMTAFARSEIQMSEGTLVWEFRSVNQRYLEPSFRLPDMFRDMESLLRDGLRKHLSRGKVECTLKFHDTRGEINIGVVNLELAQQIMNAVDMLKGIDRDLEKVNPLELLRWPGIMQSPELNVDLVKENILLAFKTGVADLAKARQREGQALKHHILERVSAIKKIVALVKALLPQIIENQRQTLLSKFAELQLDIDAQRVEQEIVILTQKLDVAEEIDRLGTHANEVERVLNQQGAVGRKLDFLMQEMNREANTLSSKSAVIETTNHAVELKVLIEQMREQIQNIE